MHHSIKIKRCYFIHIRELTKLFEIRFNDRDYQVNDTVNFIIIEDDLHQTHDDRKFKIIYIHQGLGMAPG